MRPDSPMHPREHSAPSGWLRSYFARGRNCFTGGEIIAWAEVLSQDPRSDQIRQAIRSLPGKLIRHMQNAGAASCRAHQQSGDVRPGDSVVLARLVWAEAHGVSMLRLAPDLSPKGAGTRLVEFC